MSATKGVHPDASHIRDQRESRFPWETGREISKFPKLSTGNGEAFQFTSRQMGNHNFFPVFLPVLWEINAYCLLYSRTERNLYFC